MEEKILIINNAKIKIANFKILHKLLSIIYINITK